METTKYFCGQKISDYGVQHNRVDYAALAKSFDAVLCNEITKLFYNDICGEYCEPEQVNGIIDNNDEIANLTDEFDELQEQLDELQEQLDEFDIETDSDIEKYKQLEKEIEKLQEAADNIREHIDELEREQDESPEIYQYYIISDSGYNVLKYHTNEIVYYIEPLNIYVWGVTHYGTSWDYVLTDIEIEEAPENEN